MKRALILCLFLFLSETGGNCATPFFSPLQPLNSTKGLQNEIGKLPGTDNTFANPRSTTYPDISQIEQSLLGHTFSGQDISARLSRIEKKLFSTTYTSATKEQRIDNIISNYNQISKYPNISKNVLSEMESHVLHQNYKQNGAERRIERLEQQILGAVQSGDLTARYEVLKIAVKNYNASQRAYAPVVSGNGGLRGLMKNLSGSFSGGSMTGFTPQIDPFSNYATGYNNNRNYNNYNNSNNGYNANPNFYSNSYTNAYPNGSGIYRGYRSNNGYVDDFKNYSSSTGVTILD